VATELDDGTQRLQVIQYGESIAVDVDVSGLIVDFDCAKDIGFQSPESVRIQLLQNGCAELVSDSPIPAEAAAQESARSDGVGQWDGGLPARLGEFLGWLILNWRDVLPWVGLAIGVFSLPWVARAIDRHRAKRFERDIHAVLAGSTGAGKTDLWIAWRDDTAPNSNSVPTVGVKRSERAEAVAYGRYSLFPYITDAAGSEPWQIARQLRLVPRKAKKVLIIVVAPCAQNTTPDREFDAEYIAEQKGYLNLPRSILGGGEVAARPDLVVMFATKFDLLSDVGPTDSNGAATRKLVEKEFSDHRSLVEGQCKKAKIPFAWIVGSAKTGWGVRELREVIRKDVMK